MFVFTLVRTMLAILESMKPVAPDNAVNYEGFQLVLRNIIYSLTIILDIALCAAVIISALVPSTHYLPNTLRRDVEISSDISECFTLIKALFDQHISSGDSDHAGKWVEQTQYSAN